MSNFDQFQQEYANQQAQSERKRKSRSALWIGSIIALVLVIFIIGGTAVGTYNSLTNKREAVKNEFANVDVQLQRRADLVPNLVNTVKGYASHEEKVFNDIAAARSRLLSAGSPEEKMAANEQLSGALGRLLVITENYPNLKADQQFTKLMDELAGTENRIGIARRDYNQTVLSYNTARQQFPTVLMASMLGFERAEEFKAEEASRTAPKVDFSK